MPNPSVVFLCRVANASSAGWPAAVDRLLDEADLDALAARNDHVAIKVHTGEPGVATALPPEVAGVVARRLRSRGALPFFTDTAVLYASRRATGPGHAEVAAENGFTLARAGAVFVPADGLLGNLEVEVPIGGRHFAQVGVAETIAHVGAVVVVSHATGHLLAGFGATLKNLGMGCASRKGKLLQHCDTKPFVKDGRCEACGVCVEHCPGGALAQLADGRARLDETACTGCGECLARCACGAIGFRWDTGSAALQEKMVEHALGVTRVVGKRLLYLVGIVDITKHCDCMTPGSERVSPDVGFAMSTDPVALDQAVLDLVADRAGTRLDRLAWPELDGDVQLAYAQEMGLGRRAYSLVEVS
jgi:hypothetical protein